ncbi:unnamed protein product [Arctogadus glacialis]
MQSEAKLFAEDPVMGVTDPPLPELAGGSRGLAAPLGTSWGSEVDLTEASQPLELTQPDAIEASLLTKPRAVTPSRGGGESIGLGSDEDEDDYSFSPRTASPMVVGGACTVSLNPAISMDLHEACKKAAARLNIEWPEPPVETATSR